MTSSSSLFLLLLIFRFADGAFTPSSARTTFANGKLSKHSLSSTQLGVSISASFGSNAVYDEEEAQWAMNHARECAYGGDDDDDTCSIEEAKIFLNSILEVQSGCAAGTLASADLCDSNVDTVADIVAHLRAKVERGRSNDDSAVAATKSTAAAPHIPLAVVASAWMIGLAMVGAGMAMTTSWSEDRLALTMGEWWWAVRDGYLDTMIAHFIQYGGY